MRCAIIASHANFFGNGDAEDHLIIELKTLTCKWLYSTPDVSMDFIEMPSTPIHPPFEPLLRIEAESSGHPGPREFALWWRLCFLTQIGALGRHESERKEEPRKEEQLFFRTNVHFLLYRTIGYAKPPPWIHLNQMWSFYFILITVCNKVHSRLLAQHKPCIPFDAPPQACHQICFKLTWFW